MDVGDLLLAVAAPEVRVHRAALDRAGPDQRDFHHEVVEAARPQPRQRRHLRAALDLEHADGVGRAQQVVDLVLLRDRREVDVDALVGRGRGRPRGAASSACPARAGRTSPGPAAAQSSLSHWSTDRPSMRAHSIGQNSTQRAVGHHHAAGMDAEVAREVDHLGRERERERRDRRRSRRGAAPRRSPRRRATCPARSARTGAACRACLRSVRGFPRRNGGVSRTSGATSARRRLRARPPSGSTHLPSASAWPGARPAAFAISRSARARAGR